AQTQRLLLAERLITDSSLPLTEIAFASGFASVRRFNALFRERYALSPSEIRRRPRAAQPDEALAFELPYRPPFAWAPVLAYLEGRAFAGVEVVLDGRYVRTASLAGRAGWIAVRPAAGRDALRLEVSAPLLRPAGTRPQPAP